MSERAPKNFPVYRKCIFPLPFPFFHVSCISVCFYTVSLSLSLSPSLSLQFFGFFFDTFHCVVSFCPFVFHYKNISNSLSFSSFALFFPFPFPISLSPN